MALNQPNLGTSPNDGTGSTLRELGQIVKDIITNMWDTVTGGIAYMSGMVGINITPTAKLHVKGDGTGTGRNFILADSGEVERFAVRDDGAIISIKTYDDTTATAANMVVAASGLFQRSTSSKEIKKEIKYNVDHELVIKLKPATFTEKSTGKKFMGFVAEDVNEIDERFATNQKEKGMMGLDVNAILAAAISTIKNQEKRISNLETVINNLK